MSKGMKSQISSGLITFEFDQQLLHTIEDALGDLRGESRKVLKNAVNKTAKQAKEKLAEKAKETYVVKKTRFTKAMATKNATVSKPEATIEITGTQLELKDFKVSPATYNPSNRPSMTKAKVLLSSSMKPLQAGSKAFLAKFANGHVSVVQRRTRRRFPLKKLLSNSIPTMIGSQERVYGIVEPDIYNDLMANIHAEIGKVLNKR